MPNRFNKIFITATILSLTALGARAELVATRGAGKKAVAAPVATSGEVPSTMKVPVAHVPNSPALNEGTPAGGQVAAVFARVHHVNMMEIEAGRLAWQKGQSQTVRDYGERLMRDHQINDRRLMKYVADNSIPIDRTPATTAEQAAKDAEMTVKLVAAAPADFDRLFLQMMSAGHADSVNELTGAIEQMADRKSRNFLSKFRPILVQHEQLGNILLDKSS